jgi:anti-sigma factor RsiW
MLSCEVIADLMVVYASGEASAETRRLVEAHLERCPACREAFGKEAGIEQALADLEPPPQAEGGWRFIARTRRLVFAIGTGALAIFACVLVAFERAIAEDLAGISMPGLPGSALLWLPLAAASLVAYLLLLLWRSRWKAPPQRGHVLAALLTSVPFFVIALAAYHLANSGTTASLLAAALLLAGALAVTYLLLPRLPYVTVTTVLVLLLVNGLLLARAVWGVAALGDFTWQTPAGLGHPAAGTPLKDAARADLSSLGLAWVESAAVRSSDGVWIGPQGEGMRAAYKGEDGRAYLTVLRFESQRAADAFFVAWRDAVSQGVRLAHLEINLPGLPGQGRIARSYSARAGQAYNAWQAENWVTIVEVPGSFSWASPLAREIKEVVAERYDSKGEG